MPRQSIRTGDAPRTMYSGSQGGSYVLVSGIVGIDPSTGNLAGDTIRDQRNKP